jgi:hypothetical protein
MAERALDREHLGQAEALLGELAEVPEALSARLAALRTAVGERADELASLREAAEARAYGLSQRERLAAATVQTVVTGGGLLVAAWLDHTGRWTPGHGAHIASAVLLAFLATLATLRLVPDATTHPGTRAVLSSASMILVGVLAAAVFSAIAGIEVAYAVGLDLMLVGVGVCVASFFAERHITLPGIGMVLSAFVIALWPAQYLWILAGVNFGIPAVLGMAMRLGRVAEA